MNPYTKLAPFYDNILKHVDYLTWYKYIKSIMYRYGHNPKRVLEIGTGTGKFGAKFSADGIEIYGMDKSVDMLVEASRRRHKNFRVFAADIRDFRLNKKFDFIFAVHDTMNYITDKDDLRKALKNIYNIMDEDSIFMFDTTTEYNVLTNFNRQTNRFTIDDTRIIWSNTYDRKTKIITSTLDFLMENGDKVTESHNQRIYSKNAIKEILRECNFEVLDIFGDYTFQESTDQTIMVNYIVRKKK